LVVVYGTFAIEFVVFPLSLVGDCAVGIVEYTETVHLIVIPFAVVIAPLFVKEFAFSMTEAVNFGALVTGSCIVFFDDLLCEGGLDLSL
jgi:hypothetical protein